MSSQSQLTPCSRQVCVLIAAGVNDAQELHGRRLAEALRSLGLAVDVGKLDEPIEKTYDLCVLPNLFELLFGGGSAGGMSSANVPAQGKLPVLAAIQHLRRSCRHVAGSLLDRADIVSYEEIHHRCRSAGIDTILDFGFRDRSAALSSSARSLYHFIPNGLTPLEQAAVNHERNEDERPIPWVFMGHASAHRVALVHQLITRVDPRGFVYMPNAGKGATNDLQPLNQRQYETVLGKCRYYIEYSNEQHFGLQSERFRLSLLTGCVPIEVISDDQGRPSHFPFDYLVLRESELAEKIRQFSFPEIQRRFRADFLAMPCLAEGLAKFLIARSLLAGEELPISKSRAA